MNVVGGGEGFRVGRDAGTLLLTLDQPARRNPIGTGVRRGLAALWSEVARDASVRCVIVTGSPPGFCSGADVGELGAAPPPDPVPLDEELAFLPGRRLRVPVIAAVNGVCAGGGLHFVADADFAIAAESASFLDPHVGVGQVSGIEPASLALRMPLGAISRLVLAGRAGRIGAAEALRLGLVIEVLPDAGLMPRALELAAAVADASPAALAETRRLLRDLVDSVLEPAMAAGWLAVQRHRDHPDSAEGPAAFAEHRPPRWGPAP